MTSTLSEESGSWIGYLPAPVASYINDLPHSQLLFTAIASATMVLGLCFVVLVRRKKKATERNKALRLGPAVAFLQLLTSSEAGSSKRFLSAFHPSVHLLPGVLLAMRRCVMAELGVFRHVRFSDAILAPSKSKGAGPSTLAQFSAIFGKDVAVPCEVAWVTASNPSAASSTMVVKITHFHLSPATSLSLLPHVDPRDFEDQGEKFVASAFQRTPSVAVSMMGPTLRQKFPDEASFFNEMVSVVRAIGGLKEKKLDIDCSNSAATTIREKPAMTLEYVVKGTVRDAAVKLSCALFGTDFVVVSFTFTALAAHQRHVVIEK